MNVDEMLKTLEPPAAWAVDGAGALRKIHAAAKLQSQQRTWRPALVAAASLTAMLLLPATRSGAQWVWRILHVEQVRVIEVPVESAPEVPASEAASAPPRDLSSPPRYELPPEVLALKANLLSPAGPLTAAASRADAEGQIGFPLRLPRAGILSAEPHLLVMNPGPTYEQLLDRAKFQAVLESLRRPELVVPPAPDGARIRVGFSAGAAALYGQCDDVDCDVTISQTMAPQIAVSDGVDLGKWIGFILRLAGISDSDALRYTATMKNVLPIILLTSPASGVLGETRVRGVPAALFQREAADGTARSALLWIAGGRMYSLSVRGSADFALTIANSLE
jgi:hypothetical protein